MSRRLPDRPSFDWYEQMAARLGAVPPAPTPGRGSGARAQIPEPYGLPDNPVAAQRVGWAYVGGAFPAPRAQPADMLSIGRPSAPLRAALRANPSLARELGLWTAEDQAQLVEVAALRQ